MPISTDFSFGTGGNTFRVFLMKKPHVLVVDTVTKLTATHTGAVLVGASHCGVYAVHLAARARVRALILTDAGIGLEGAGIGGLGWAEQFSLPVAAAGHMSCRIADGEDVMANGIIQHVNKMAAGLNCHIGLSVADCAERMRQAEDVRDTPPDYGEARFLIDITAGQIDVVGCDSISLLLPEDAGRFAVTASHGALLGGRVEDGLVDMALAGVTFNDAGIGKDDAGIARLSVLDDRGIPAATVDTLTARIGDAQSNWQTGMLSRVNGMAELLGVETGMTTQAFAARVRATT